MDIDLDKTIKEIVKDTKIRQGKSVKFAGYLDTATIMVFYYLCFMFFFDEQWLNLARVFGLMTLWKISMALQDIIQRLNCLNILKIINFKEKQNDK